MPIYAGMPVRDAYDAAALSSRNRQASEQMRLAEQNALIQQRQADEKLLNDYTLQKGALNLRAAEMFANGGDAGAAIAARSRDNLVDNATQRYGIATQAAVAGANLESRAQDREARSLGRDYSEAAGSGQPRSMSPFQRMLLETQAKTSKQVAEARQSGLEFHPDQQTELDGLDRQADKIRRQELMNGISAAQAQAALLGIEQEKSVIVPRVQKLTDDEIFLRNTAPGPGGVRYGLDTNGRPDYSKPITRDGGKSKPYTVTDWKSLREVAVKELNPGDDVGKMLAPEVISRKMQELQDQYDAFRSGDFPVYNLPKSSGTASVSDVRSLFVDEGAVGDDPRSRPQRILDRLGPYPYGEPTAWPPVEKTLRATPGLPGPIDPLSLRMSPQGGVQEQSPQRRASVFSVTPKNLDVVTEHAAKSGDAEVASALQIIKVAAAKHGGMPKRGTPDYAVVQQALELLNARGMNASGGQHRLPPGESQESYMKSYGRLK